MNYQEGGQPFQEMDTGGWRDNISLGAASKLSFEVGDAGLYANILGFIGDLVAQFVLVFV